MNSSTRFSADRRAFLGKVSLTVGGIAVAGLSPATLLQAAPTGLVCGYQDPCGDWQLDDICSSYPPYALHLDAGVPRHGQVTAMVAAEDRHWVS